MIKSMTGYSHKKIENDNFSCLIDVKSLNSKFLDAQIRLHRAYADREIEVRSKAADVLKRGKVSITIDIEFKGDAKPNWRIDEEAFRKYYEQLATLQKTLGDGQGDIFGRILEIPEVTHFEETEGLEEYWKEISTTLNEALGECDNFRLEEGENLKAQLVAAIDTIKSLKSEVDGLAGQRSDRVREKMRNGLEALDLSANVDENRLEQEILYYLEKMDISEELVRMDSHMEFFMSNLNSDESQGKKLTFISQEIGREINTIGSKANDATIQRLVVSMKDELEKIKEQLSNIL